MMGVIYVFRKSELSYCLDCFTYLWISGSAVLSAVTSAAIELDLLFECKIFLKVFLSPWSKCGRSVMGWKGKAFYK